MSSKAALLLSLLLHSGDAKDWRALTRMPYELSDMTATCDTGARLLYPFRRDSAGGPGPPADFRLLQLNVSRHHVPLENSTLSAGAWPGPERTTGT